MWLWLWCGVDLVKEKGLKFGLVALVDDGSTLTAITLVPLALYTRTALAQRQPYQPLTPVHPRRHEFAHEPNAST